MAGLYSLPFIHMRLSSVQPPPLLAWQTGVTLDLKRWNWTSKYFKNFDRYLAQFSITLFFIIILVLILCHHYTVNCEWISQGWPLSLCLMCLHLGDAILPDASWFHRRLTKTVHSLCNLSAVFSLSIINVTLMLFGPMQGRTSMRCSNCKQPKTPLFEPYLHKSCK